MEIKFKNLPHGFFPEWACLAFLKQFRQKVRDCGTFSWIFEHVFSSRAQQNDFCFYLKGRWKISWKGWPEGKRVEDWSSWRMISSIKIKMVDCWELSLWRPNDFGLNMKLCFLKMSFWGIGVCVLEAGAVHCLSAGSSFGLAGAHFEDTVCHIGSTFRWVSDQMILWLFPSFDFQTVGKL